MKLTHDNYYSAEADRFYLSASQFRSFNRCEAQTFAQIESGDRGEPNTAMLVGSYVDAYFTQDLEKFKADNPDIFLRDGKTLKAEFRGAEKMIERASTDLTFMRFLTGDTQQIVTGEIEGVPFKAMPDVVNEAKGRIVDLKTTRDFRKIWSNKVQAYVGFIEAWEYDIQGAIYRELIRQKTGKVYPFYIAAITRENSPDIEIFEIPEDVLDDTLEMVKHKVGQFSAIKEGYIDPERCGVCDYCKATKRLKDPIDFRDYVWS